MQNWLIKSKLLVKFDASPTMEKLVRRPKWVGKLVGRQIWGSKKFYGVMRQFRNNKFGDQSRNLVTKSSDSVTKNWLNFINPDCYF